MFSYMSRKILIDNILIYTIIENDQTSEYKSI